MLTRGYSTPRSLARRVLPADDCCFAPAQLPQDGDWPRPRLPVVVWVHGGGFRLGDGGDSMFGPDYLMDAGGVVVVSLNYRLGPFGEPQAAVWPCSTDRTSSDGAMFVAGFLAVGSAEAPGNAGLKDQVLGLRWVRDNIAAFGGDPEQVTLFGESAGGVSVHLHTLSPLSRGMRRGTMASS